MKETLTQDGICAMCEIETGDIYYIFCSIECQRSWCFLKESKLEDKYQVDLELYKQWLMDRTQAIENMTREDIEKRVHEIIEIQFYANRETAMLSQKWDKLNGRKGIPPWLKADRDKLITNPSISVNYDGEPRKRDKVKKDKVKKVYDLNELVGVDMEELVAKAREFKKNKAEAEKS